MPLPQHDSTVSIPSTMQDVSSAALQVCTRQDCVLCGINFRHQSADSSTGSWTLEAYARGAKHPHGSVFAQVRLWVMPECSALACACAHQP